MRGSVHECAIRPCGCDEDDVVSSTPPPPPPPPPPSASSQGSSSQGSSSQGPSPEPLPAQDPRRARTGAAAGRGGDAHRRRRRAARRRARPPRPVLQARVPHDHRRQRGSGLPDQRDRLGRARRTAPRPPRAADPHRRTAARRRHVGVVRDEPHPRRRLLRLHREGAGAVAAGGDRPRRRDPRDHRPRGEPGAGVALAPAGRRQPGRRLGAGTRLRRRRRDRRRAVGEHRRFVDHLRRLGRNDGHEPVGRWRCRRADRRRDHRRASPSTRARSTSPSATRSRGPTRTAPRTR